MISCADLRRRPRTCAPFVSLPHRSQQVRQGEPVLRPQQPGGHHARPAVLRRLRVHRRRPRHRVRAGAPRPRPRRDTRVVQRLQLARRREGLQPLRHPPPLRPPRVRRLVVRDRHPDVPGRHVDGARRRRRRPRGHGRQPRPAVVVRRRRRRDRGPALPDRLPHDHRHREPRRQDPISTRLSEPRGTAEPERAPAARHDPRRIAAGDARDPAPRAPAGERLPGLRRCSRGSSRAFPTTGIGRTTSPATRAGTRACSTRTSRRSAST